MGLGRTWNEGHGSEFKVLSEAFKSATDSEKIEAFRGSLAAGTPIMTARQILHGPGPFTRTNSFGVHLQDRWDPNVTQFRWYDPRAHFWLQSRSKPYQIDAVMRRALLAACDLWSKGYTDIEFCGVCEQEEFRIRYNTVDDATPKQARFWVEVPDHWASYDVTGRDGDDRDVRRFLVEWGVGDRPAGAAVCTSVKGGELRRGQPFDPTAFDGDSVDYTLIAWADEADGGIEPQGIGSVPVPDSEVRRIERMKRLAETATWTVRPDDGAVDELAPVVGDVAASARLALHGAPVKEELVEGGPIVRGGLGRYGRLFPAGEPPPEELLGEVGAIAGRMTSGQLGEIPTEGYSDAGYAFLGQFIDHDVTFDSSSSLQRALDPHSLVDFRTPRLDLDSIYGGGPAQQPYLYDENGRFVLGADISYDGRYRPDVARTERGVALIGDPRNDQNAILSQLTVLFLRFHNAVVDGLHRPGAAAGLPFAEAQQEVRWHYQWLLVHHFLPAVIGPGKAASYLWSEGARPTGPELAAALAGGGLKLSVAGDPWETFMPVEFSAAAFRFGHSMLRPSYRTTGDGPAIPTISRAGLLRRPSSAVDWRYFVSGLGDPKLVQASAAIDTHLLPELGDVGKLGLVPPSADDPVSLPARTLLRGLRLQLPTGQSAVAELNRLGYRIQALDADEIGLESMRSAEETPLWYYVLREAELTRGGATLGLLGGTLVAEVLLGLLVHDPSSFLHAGWAPPTGDFTFADLVRAAESWAAG